MFIKRRILNACLTAISKFSSNASITPNSPHVNLYTNPCVKLSEYLEVPFFDKTEQLFSPGFETMYRAHDLFIPKPGHEILSVARTIDPQKYPDHDLPEIVFLGRSNAGKSSLLKAIFHYVPDLNIRVSKKPGHTKGAHFFKVGSKLCLVDMPGYGELQPKWFSECVGNYLKIRKNLIRAFLLIDGNIGFQTKDEVALDMLEGFNTPYALIMTKIDKAPDSRILRNLLHLKQLKDKYMSLCCFPQPFLVSSSTNEGLAHLLAFIGHITGNLDIDP